MTEILAEFYSAKSSTDFWISNEKFNALLKEATEVRMTPNGILEFCFNGTEKVMGVKFKNTLIHGKNEIAYVQIEYIKAYGNGLYDSRENAGKTKKCKIL